MVKAVRHGWKKNSSSNPCSEIQLVGEGLLFFFFFFFLYLTFFRRLFSYVTYQPLKKIGHDWGKKNLYEPFYHFCILNLSFGYTLSLSLKILIGIKYIWHFYTSIWILMCNNNKKKKKGERNTNFWNIFNNNPKGRNKNSGYKDFFVYNSSKNFYTMRIHFWKYIILYNL